MLSRRWAPSVLSVFQSVNVTVRTVSSQVGRVVLLSRLFVFLAVLIMIRRSRRLLWPLVIHDAYFFPANIKIVSELDSEVSTRFVGSPSPRHLRAI